MKEKKDLWGKYIEIKLKNGGVAKGLVIAQSGGSISISDEFKTLAEYQNYKPRILESCGVVYPRMDDFDWNEIADIEIRGE